MVFSIIFGIIISLIEDNVKPLVTTQLINYIKYELQTRKSMGIPGLGTLSLHRQPASFSEDNHSITPPSYNLQFQPQDSTTKSLPQLIQNELNHLSSLIAEDLTKYGRSKIKNLGTFMKDGDQVKFISDPNFESSYTSGLKTIENVKIVSKSYEGKSDPIISTDTLLTKKPVKDYRWIKDLLTYLLYGLLILGLIYAFLNLRIPTSKNIDEIVPNKDQIEIVKQDTPSQISEEVLIEDTIQQALIDTANQILEEHNIPSKSQSSPQNETQLSKGSAEKEITITKTEVPAKAKKEDRLIAINKIPKAKTLPKKKNELGPKQQKKDSIFMFDIGEMEEIYGRPCVVITGVFSQSANVIKMIKQLQAKGYRIYAEEINGLTRVGVKYQCNITNADTLISKLKDQFNKEAWILQ